MTAGRVQIGFFSYPNPARLVNEFFFAGPRPALSGPTGPIGPWYFRAHYVAQNFFLPNTDFLSNQTSRRKRIQENPDLNKSETNKNHYFLSNQQIGTRIIKIALKLENINLITIENTTDRNKNHYFSLQIFSHIKSNNEN